MEELGYPHKFIQRDDKLPDDVKIVLIQGPYGTLAPLIRQLVNMPSEKRPILAYWWQQSMELALPEVVRRPLMELFSDLFRELSMPRIKNNKWWSKVNEILASSGRRLGYMGDLVWLQKRNLLDVLALSSTVYQDYLGRFGIDSLLIPRGYHPAYGKMLNLKRDIPAVWMGKMRTRRRARAIAYIQKELARRGKELRSFDGVTHDFIFDEDRTRLLNRTQFMVNVHFSGRTDELSIRYFIAAANGAVNITEPGANEYPFIAGQHLIESSVEAMPETMLQLMKHPNRLATISQNMLSLMQRELTLSRSISRLLSRAEEAFGTQSASHQVRH